MKKSKTNGSFSRSKGKRNEYLVRDALRKEGFEVERVPASGAAQGFKGDLRVKHGGKEILVEVKARMREFTAAYEAVEAFGPVITTSGIIITPVARDVLDTGFTFVTGLEPVAKLNKLLVKLKGYLGPCDVLAIKDNKKAPLYLRWYQVDSIEELPKAGNA